MIPFLLFLAIIIFCGISVLSAINNFIFLETHSDKNKLSIIELILIFCPIINIFFYLTIIMS